MQLMAQEVIDGVGYWNIVFPELISTVIIFGILITFKRLGVLSFTFIDEHTDEEGYNDAYKNNSSKTNQRV